METFHIRSLKTLMKFNFVNFSWEPSFPVTPEAPAAKAEIYLFIDKDGSLIERAKTRAARGSVIRSCRDLYSEIFDIEKRRTFCFFKEGISIDFLVEREMTQSFLVFQGFLDIVFLHAATVIIEDKAHLFVAPSGGGKSTISSLAGENAFDVLGDESCFVKREKERFFTGHFPVSLSGGLSSKMWEIGGVFFLNKSGRNSLESLPVTEAIRRAVPEATCFYRDRIPESEVIGNRRRIFNFLDVMFDNTKVGLLNFTQDPRVFSCIN